MSASSSRGLAGRPVPRRASSPAEGPSCRVERATGFESWRNGATVGGNDVHKRLDQLVAPFLSRVLRPLQPHVAQVGIGT